MTDKEKKILEVLKNSENALSAKEIAVMMYGPDSTQQLVYSKLLKLEALGYVEKFYSKRSYKFIITGEGETIKLPDTEELTPKEEVVSKESQAKTTRLPRKEYNVNESLRINCW